MISWMNGITSKMEILPNNLSDQFQKSKQHNMQKSSVNFNAVLAANLEQASPQAAILAADEVHKQRLKKEKAKKAQDVQRVSDSEKNEALSVRKTIQEIKKRLRLVREMERKKLNL